MPINPSSIIAKKRDGYELTPDEIGTFIDGFTCGEIADYQMSAMAMAIYWRGMNGAETVSLTECMLASGTTLNWSSMAVSKVDKHSTGGIGDKVSLILAPLLACCGLQVPMLSGRGLGPTGGTLDKLESIPGFRSDLTIQEIQQLTEDVGCVITGASPELAPADRKFYALRDVTATVSSIPLITASIMSKKLAENLDALVLDVKFGSGAFMKTLDQARALAKSLVSVGERMSVPTSALLTDMNQPLGRMVGNAVELNEAVDTLQNGGPPDVRELTIELGANVLQQIGQAPSSSAAREILEGQLANGQAYEKFSHMVASQGGNLDSPRAIAPEVEIAAVESGYVNAVDAELLGYAVIELGGGRKVQTDQVDHSVGLQMLVRVGDQVVRGQPLARLFAADTKHDPAKIMVRQAIQISPDPPAALPLIAERIGGP